MSRAGRRLAVMRETTLPSSLAPGCSVQKKGTPSSERWAAAIAENNPLWAGRYLRLTIQEINAPAVKPAANVVATMSMGWRWMR